MFIHLKMHCVLRVSSDALIIPSLILIMKSTTFPSWKVENCTMIYMYKEVNLQKQSK